MFQSSNIIATMFQLLFLFFITITITSSQPANICLWNQANQIFDRLNGLYRITPQQLNGKHVWRLDRHGQGCGSPYYEIYWKYDSMAGGYGWYIVYAQSNYGKCENPSAEASPLDCGPNWAFQYPFGVSRIDPSVSVTEGRCPALNCAALTVTQYHMPTGFGYAEQTGANQYFNASQNWVWWFNTAQFKWFCTTPDIAGHTCNTTAFPTQKLLNVGAQQLWQNLNDGDVFIYDGSGTFTCSGEATTSTYQPTTPHPTRWTWTPSVAPTNIPTGGPSYGPSVYPTDGPSYGPSVAPSDGTGAPSYNPSENPSYNPSVGPTVTPSIGTGEPSYSPTGNPSENPTVPTEWVETTKKGVHNTSGCCSVFWSVDVYIYCLLGLICLLY